MREINLLPAKYINRQNIIKVVLNYLISITLTLILCSTIYLFFNCIDFIYNKEINNANKEIASYARSKEVLEIIWSNEEETLEKNIIIGDLQTSMDHNFIISELDSLVPEEVELQEILFYDQSTILIKGETKDYRKIVNFMEGVSEITDMVDVSLNSVYYSPDNQNNRFTINCTYLKEGIKYEFE